jgi:hypothetical protein
VKTLSYWAGESVAVLSHSRAAGKRVRLHPHGSMPRNEILPRSDSSRQAAHKDQAAGRAFFSMTCNDRAGSSTIRCNPDKAGITRSGQPTRSWRCTRQHSRLRQVGTPPARRPWDPPPSSGRLVFAHSEPGASGRRQSPGPAGAVNACAYRPETAPSKRACGSRSSNEAWRAWLRAARRAAAHPQPGPHTNRT